MLNCIYSLKNKLCLNKFDAYLRLRQQIQTTAAMMTTAAHEPTPAPMATMGRGFTVAECNTM